MSKKFADSILCIHLLTICKPKVMKNSFILALLIALSMGAVAQIPNPGFELWEDYVDDYTAYVYEKPDGWVGSLPRGEVRGFSLEKNNESYPPGTGQFSVRIKPDNEQGVRGVIFSNDQAEAMVNWLPKPSFAIDYKPEALYLYYKYLPFGGDSLVVQIYFYKLGEIIANSYYVTNDTISDWTALEIPLSYETEELPDSASIYFVTGAYVQHTESMLYLDNLSFTGFINELDYPARGADLVLISPNPASDILSLDFGNKEGLYLRIYTIVGALVRTEIIRPEQKQIKLEDLNEGLYFLEFSTKERTEIKKLIVKR